MSDVSASTLNDLGIRVRTARIAAGLTQAALSARAGISRDTLSRLERGSPVDTRSLCMVVAALGLRVELHRSQLRAADMRRKYAHLHEEAE
jgi:transcriptional regulator with XRE-family HTH domain